MPRAQRLEDVSCAICMDVLFNKRDDLDEVMHIATPDCGHVFHEKCLFEWFRTQSLQYVAQAREQGLRFRNGSPTFSDAPNECPTCRTECFADPETGEPGVHRLFIHFGDGEGGPAGSSSQVGSSPVRWKGTQGKGKEREMMGLARRARGLMEEVKGLSGDSEATEVEGTMRRVSTLGEDAVSVKALSGVKTYLGGLTAAINNLRATLETHPLSHTLRHQIHHAELQNGELRQQMDFISRVQTPQEIQRAVAIEQANALVRIRNVQQECDLIKRELEREQVARRVQRKAVEERERDTEKKTAEMKATLSREQADREFLSKTLNDRTKLLKVYQSKVESRRELKAKVEDLNAENTRLKAELDHSSQAETPPKLPIRRRGSSLCDILDKLAEDADTSADLSIQEIPRSSFASSQAKSKPPLSHLPDESLQVDMPDKSMRMKVESRKPHIESRSEPTARTYSFDLDEAKVKRKSKHFPSQPDDDGEDEDVIVGASSSSPSPAKRSRTNPFTTTREESEKRRVLPSKTHSSSSLGHPVDLVSPYKKPLTLAKDRNLLEKSSNSVVGWLGITDANGRPKKGVVGGVKVKRRV